ncbi:MAG TPA: DUF2284 domain-containing protein [Desulfosarcina sp.]|nr:DUF2284 domain-containing protein [Desulfosarcina sp.]
MNGLGRQENGDALTHRLVHLALGSGAGQAAVIQTRDIVVDDRLAALCRRPECEVYGLAASCPPHVGGPSRMRGLLAEVERAVVFKIDVPTPVLLTEKRLPVYRRLHEIAAAVERAAVEQGCPAARAFAGGSCKQIFCSDIEQCPVVVGAGRCRHPDRAQPSMSGYGIDVSRLMAAAGWSMRRITRDTSPEEVPMGALTGLVLIA